MNSRVSRWRPTAIARTIAVLAVLAVGAVLAVSASPGAPRAAGPAAVPPAAGAGAVPAGLTALSLPATAPAKPLLKRSATTSTCPAVRARLKQYAARHVKTVECETVGAAPAAVPGPGLARTGTRQAVPLAVPVNPLCASVDDVWVVNRTTECVQNLNIYSHIIDTNTGEVLGEGFFLFNQSVTTSTNSDEVSEADSLTFSSATGAADQLGTVTFTGACGSACKSLTGTQSFTLAPGQVKTGISVSYLDNPAVGDQDLFDTSYTLSILPAGVTFLGAATWSTPDDIRCDNQLQPRGVGCVIPAYVPDLALSVGTYGAAAMNVEYGEDFLPGTPGLLVSTPLTRGNPALSQGNRDAVCDGTFNAIPSVVATDSCDEYPFASSQQSGAVLKLTGLDCLDIIPFSSSGGWEPVFLNTYTGGQRCLRGHVPLAQNQAVGTALSSFYTLQRMLAGDPYTVTVTQ
jgi:hypothetical protein